MAASPLRFFPPSFFLFYFFFLKRARVTTNLVSRRYVSQRFINGTGDQSLRLSFAIFRFSFLRFPLLRFLFERTYASKLKLADAEK